MMKILLCLACFLLQEHVSSEQDFEIVYPHQEREGKILEELLSLAGLQDEELNIITAEKMDEDNIDYDQAPDLANISADEDGRETKSLLNTFPFNQENYSNHSGHHGHGGHGDGHHHEHHEHHGEHHQEHDHDHTEHDHLDHDHHDHDHADHEDDADNTLVAGATPLRGSLRGDRRPASSAAAPHLQFPFNLVRGSGEDTAAASSVLCGGPGGGCGEAGDLATNQIEDSSLVGNALGKKCVEKVMMVEETVYDEELTCDHSYDQRCHTSYVTTYRSQQEEDCEENFRKVCYINFEPRAFNETVEVCHTPLVKNCTVPGPEVCRTEYETWCMTRQRLHETEDDVPDCRTETMQKCVDVTQGYQTKAECEEWPVQRCSLERVKVTKYTPETSCQAEPRELCAPVGCGVTNGELTCRNETKTVVVESPVESCELEPVRQCHHVTKQVPLLVPKQECVQVPKEVCSRSRTNPHKKRRPVIKKWCYTPTLESGLLS